jgi:hypothetical protein
MRKLVSPIVAVLFCAAATSTVYACAVMPRPDRVVRVDGEEVLIVWDARARREHLIRHIGFRGDTDDFGFLVPTPSTPEVAEVRGLPFDPLYRLYYRPAPVRRARGRRSVQSSSAMSSGAAPSVRVVAQHELAGQTATVLAANDASALNSWLASHGYPHGPALQEYVTPYVRRGWMITAFRYVARGAQVRSPVIRLSFDTERPFFPYAEPASTEARPARHFRVSVLARRPMQGQLSANGDGGRGWGAEIGFRRRLTPAETEGVQSASRLTTDPALRYLTVFDEPRSVRGDLDLWFRPQRGAPNVQPSLHTAVAPVRQQGPNVQQGIDF